MLRNLPEVLLRGICLTCLLAGSAAACPNIAGMVDVGCDQVQKVVVTGDSVVSGVGCETPYPELLQRRFADATIENLGVSGISAFQLLRDFKSNLRKRRKGRTFQATEGADTVVIDVGRNDYWRRVDPGVVAATIKRIVKLLRRELGANVIVAALMPNNRDVILNGRTTQSEFVKDVNHSLLKINSKRFPVHLRFDRMSSSLVNSDGLHPSDGGCEQMAAMTGRYLLSRRARRTALQRVPGKGRDRDSDRLFDAFEPQFGTDPGNRDTDGDGVIDGDEVEAGTDPTA